ncbi:MAG: FtsW/RodA/SpoVE family cell cycle protein [Candidatus Azotimanducaceae bacterium]
MISKRCAQAGFSFHAHLAAGISLLIGVQASINLGVNLGLLPTKGLTLPLMSFGGNSLLVSLLPRRITSSAGLGAA